MADIIYQDIDVFLICGVFTIKFKEAINTDIGIMVNISGRTQIYMYNPNVCHIEYVFYLAYS